MTQDEWDICSDPQIMLAALSFPRSLTSGASKTTASRRKMRLLACVMAERQWEFMAPVLKNAVCVAERFADGFASSTELRSAWRKADTYQRRKFEAGPNLSGEFQASVWPAAAADRDEPMGIFTSGCLSGSLGAAALKEVIEGPTVGPAFSRGWRTLTVMSIARAIYAKERDGTGLDGQALLVLADALEEAGCADGRLMAHLRRPTATFLHYQGCWALDKVLGNERIGPRRLQRRCPRCGRGNALARLEDEAGGTIYCRYCDHAVEEPG